MSRPVNLEFTSSVEQAEGGIVKLGQSVKEVEEKIKKTGRAARDTKGELEGVGREGKKGADEAGNSIAAMTTKLTAAAGAAAIVVKALKDVYDAAQRANSEVSKSSLSIGEALSATGDTGTPTLAGRMRDLAARTGSSPEQVAKAFEQARRADPRAPIGQFMDVFEHGYSVADSTGARDAGAFTANQAQINRLLGGGFGMRAAGYAKLLDETGAGAGGMAFIEQASALGIDIDTSVAALRMAQASGGGPAMLQSVLAEAQKAVQAGERDVRLPDGRVVRQPGVAGGVAGAFTGLLSGGDIPGVDHDVKARLQLGITAFQAQGSLADERAAVAGSVDDIVTIREGEFAAVPGVFDAKFQAEQEARQRQEREARAAERARTFSAAAQAQTRLIEGGFGPRTAGFLAGAGATAAMLGDNLALYGESIPDPVADVVGPRAMSSGRMGRRLGLHRTRGQGSANVNVEVRVEPADDFNPANGS